jgi:hypothetical protein
VACRNMTELERVDIENRLPVKEMFLVTIRPIHKLVMMVLVEEQTFKIKMTGKVTQTKTMKNKTP